MINWPEAVVIIVVLLVGYGAIDTWLKRPYFEKRVGSMVIKMRGEEARTAMAHHNSLTVMGFHDAIEPTSDELLEDAAKEHKDLIDEASGERDNLDGRTYPELADDATLEESVDAMGHHLDKLDGGRPSTSARRER